jgi:alginate O-acetyltransferase complex protein AlgI
MIFNSVEFLVFFVSVFAIYVVLEHRYQNYLLLVASYVFYGSWDWRFIPLLLFSSWLSYFSGLKISESSTPRAKRSYLQMTLAGEIALLAVFKYLNFFVENVIEVLSTFGISGADYAVKIILPLGISYYTFQAIAYAFDVYRGKIEACTNIWDFLLFKSFFPILFSGPIERAGNLLVQIQAKRTLDKETFRQGLFLIGWGLFKKIYIADNIAKIVNHSFSNSGSLNAVETWIAAYGFAIQIYCDFSGYTDMARGLARLMGFNLVPNFNLPYFASNPMDFWKRWHMSLSNWFGDYVLNPLFFATKSAIPSLFITILLVGIWHGASWNFFALGVYNASVISAYVFLAPRCRFFLAPKSPHLKTLVKSLSILLMFHVTCLNLVFFRSQSLGQIAEMASHLFFGSFSFTEAAAADAFQLVFFSLPLVLMKSFQLWANDLEVFLKLPKKAQLVASLTAVWLVFMVYLFTNSVGKGHGEFIYFQF